MIRICKKHPSILLAFCLTVLAGSILLPYIITDTPFMLGWDMRTQYSSFYENLKTMFIEMKQLHSLPFYSWATFLGNNFWGSKLFYYHDVFDYFTLLLFPFLEYNRVIMLQTFVKLIIAGFCFYHYGRYHRYSEATNIIGSLMFAFSSYALETLKDPFFLSFYIFIPLYFLTIDKYLQEKKKLGYIIITAFLAVTNYYHFYSLSIFSVFYFIYRYSCLHQTIKGFFKEALLLIGCYFIAVMIAGFALVPEAFNIITNQRIGNSSAFLKYDSIKTYFYVLTGLFFPSSIIINRTNEFSSIYTFVSQNNTVLYVCLWAGSLCSLLLPQIFSKKEENKNTKLFLFLNGILMLIPIGSSMMHGFSEPAFRWLQFPLFMNITFVLPYLENIRNTNKKLLFYSVVFISGILLLGTPLLGIFAHVPFEQYSREYALILTTLPFLWMAYFIVIKGNRTGLIVFTFTEMLIVSYLSVYSNSYYRQFSKDTIQGVTHVLQNRNDLNRYLLELDEQNKNEFYRIYIDPSSVYWDYSTNLNLNFNIMGLMTYDSTVSSSIVDMNKISRIESYLPWSYEIKDPALVDFLCTKYAIVTDASQLPHQDFVQVGEFNYLPVYQNLHYQNFLRSYNKISILEQTELKSEDILDTLIVSQIDYELLSNNVSLIGTVTCTYVNHSGNTVFAGIDSSAESFISVAIPYDQGWNVKVNGQTVDIYSVNGGMIGFSVPSGYSEIQMIFTPQGFKIGLAASFFGLIALASLFVYEKRIKKQH
ncbi:YfhO family protein [Holdemania massiliensis]|uniref:YfhO family protein n=1 Tax=Holdemania massiliensis TaxID=1468449 RepID=UPI0035211C88